MNPEEMINTIDTKKVICEAARAAFDNGRGRPLLDDSRLIGTLYESADAVYCYLEEIVPRDVTASPGEQTRSIFQQIESGLASAGMKFTDLVRTWFYLDGILDWYDEFNQARTPFLEAHGVLQGRVPASTGVGMRNRFGAAGVAGAFAVKAKSESVRIEEVASPMQCSALHYRSSFSRAVEISREGSRELYISGTASIEPGGKTAHLDDFSAQVALSMDVVEAILTSRGMKWTDCTRAIGYIQDPVNAPLLTDYLCKHGLQQLPVTFMHADICRSDLLFEIELEAMTATPKP